MYRDDKIVMNFYLVDKCILWEKLNVNLKKKKIKFYTELLKWWKESNEWFINIYVYILLSCSERIERRTKVTFANVRTGGTI